MHKDGKTTAQIAMILKRSRSWVSKWKHQHFSNFRAKPRSGRPKISLTEQKNIIKASRHETKGTLRQLQSKY